MSTFSFWKLTFEMDMIQLKESLILTPLMLMKYTHHQIN